MSENSTDQFHSATIAQNIPNTGIIKYRNNENNQITNTDNNNSLILSDLPINFLNDSDSLYFNIDKSYIHDDDNFPLDPYIDELLQTNKQAISSLVKNQQLHEIEIIKLKNEIFSFQSQNSYLVEINEKLDLKLKSFLAQFDEANKFYEENKKLILSKENEILQLNNKFQTELNEMTENHQQLMKEKDEAHEIFMEEKEENDQIKEREILLLTKTIAELKTELNQNKINCEKQIQKINEDKNTEIELITLRPFTSTTQETEKLNAHHRQLVKKLEQEFAKERETFKGQIQELLQYKERCRLLQNELKQTNNNSLTGRNKSRVKAEQENEEEQNEDFEFPDNSNSVKPRHRPSSSNHQSSARSSRSKKYPKIQQTFAESLDSDSDYEEEGENKTNKKRQRNKK